MGLRSAASLVLATILISGCNTISTSSDYVRGTNFSSLKTYNWVTVDQPVTGDIRVDNTLVDSRIRKAIEANLSAKGYEKLTSGDPDFLVSYQAAIEGKLDVTTVSMPYSVPSIDPRGNYRGGAYYGGGFYGSAFAYGGSETFVSQYDEGSVFIDIVNPKTKKIMWRGIGKATVLEKATPEKREARINEGVTKILSEFPPV